jgi:hypothetical protein
VTLGRVQRGLEQLYRVDTGVTVDDFVIDQPTRDSLVEARRPREQLLVVEDAGEMSLALFVDPRALENLERNDPSRALGDHNLGDFLLAVEGVSHFIYAICAARVDRKVSQLELELQAEVDKYVTCLLTTDPARSQEWRERLFGEAIYDDDLDQDESQRYRVANDNAQRYSAFLETEFVARRRIPEMLGELRRFYRKGLAAKLSTIATAA